VILCDETKNTAFPSAPRRLSWVTAVMNPLTIYYPEGIHGLEHVETFSPPTDWELVVLPISGRSLELLVARAEKRGPVIVVVLDEEEAERALDSSADEVLLAGDLSGQAIRTAIVRAMARRRGFGRREARAANDRRQLSASTLEALLGGACLQVEVALVRASEQCALLEDLVSQGIARELDAMRRRTRGIFPPLEGPIAPSAAARPDSGGSAGAIGRSVDEVSTSLREAIEIASRVKSLLLPTGASHIDLREVVVEIVALVRPAIETIAEFVVSVPDERCIVRLPRWQAIQAIGGLLTNAVGAARERGGSDRFIQVRLVREHDDAAVEVADDGVGLSEIEVQAIHEGAESAPHVTPNLIRLAFASSVARQGKGELLISSRPAEGTTARMYIKLAETG
jgi:signal transduction histidine kinase